MSNVLMITVIGTVVLALVVDMAMLVSFVRNWSGR